MQVEDFTGPAGTDRLGVDVLEAVHRSQPSKAGLPPFAQRKVKMPGQVVIITHGSQGSPSGLMNSQVLPSWEMLTPPSWTAV